MNLATSSCRAKLITYHTQSQLLVLYEKNIGILILWIIHGDLGNLPTCISYDRSSIGEILQLSDRGKIKRNSFLTEEIQLSSTKIYELLSKAYAYWLPK